MGFFGNLLKKTEPKAEQIEKAPLNKPVYDDKTLNEMQELALKSNEVRREKRLLFRDQEKLALERAKIQEEIEKVKYQIVLEEQKAKLRELQEDLADSRAEDEEPKDSGMNADALLMGLLTNIMTKQQAPVQQMPVAQAQTIQQAPVQQQEEIEEPLNSRFTDEQIKATIPKLLSKTQIQQLKSLNLTDDELLQLGDAIKTL